MKTATKKTKKVRIRTFRGLPLRDATHDLLLQVTNSDKKKGIPKDPEHCAMAVSWCRMAGDPQAEAVIGRGIAHIKMRDEDGMWFWCRFRLTELTALRARKFDRTGIADEAGYRLTAPSISQNLDYRAAHPWKKEIKRPGSRRRYHTKPITLASTFRNTAGMFQTGFVELNKR